MSVDGKSVEALPTKQPAFEFPEAQARAFRFRFEGLLPPQLLPQLIVDRHADIEGDLVWRHGVILRTTHHGGARALVQEDVNDRHLALWITGKGLEHYFGVLYDEVKAIIQTMPELPCEELIRLPASARLDKGFDRDGKEPWARWESVLGSYLRRETVHYEGLAEYDLKSVLGIIDKSRLEEYQSSHVHHHYSEKTVNQHFNNYGQAGSMGNDNQVTDNTFQNISLNLTQADLSKLDEELGRLLEAMKKRPDALSHVQDLAVVENAHNAAKQGDESKLLGHLKKAGKWSFDVATAIGVELLAEVLKKTAGL
jgi:hypothetical protein